MLALNWSVACQVNVANPVPYVGVFKENFVRCSTTYMLSGPGKLDVERLQLLPLDDDDDVNACIVLPPGSRHEYVPD